MKKKNLDFAGFLKLMIDALQASGVEYLIGGAIAEWAWGEPRAIQDLDLVVKIPIKSINKLSKELEKRDMLVPAEIGCWWKTGRSIMVLRWVRSIFIQKKICIYTNSSPFGPSQQSKHSRDIAAILKSKKDALDLNYIEQWVNRLGGRLDVEGYARNIL
jgi:hypothetical protein